MKYDTSKIMKRAWEIAKLRAENYEGSPRDYLHATLRFAWAEAKVRFDLPALDGSAKQIEWAEKIRRCVVLEMTKYMAGTMECRVPFRRPLPVQIIEGCASQIDWMNGQNFALSDGRITPDEYSRAVVALAAKVVTVCHSAAWYIDHFKDTHYSRRA